jgi:hypothetical protein
VVDTLRHQETLVSRELSEESRDAELLERQRKIYRGQGIEVSDQIRNRACRLKEQRFVHTPPPPSFKRTIAAAWVRSAGPARPTPS